MKRLLDWNSDSEEASARLEGKQMNPFKYTSIMMSQLDSFEASVVGSDSDYKPLTQWQQPVSGARQLCVRIGLPFVCWPAAMDL